MTSKEIILTLQNCAIACEECATACLKEEDANYMRQCILIDRDCADICRITATLLARRSVDTTILLAAVCAKVCEACAEECEKHDIEHCQLCAQACRECVTACHTVI